jgi:hypothetical protein
LLANFFTRYFVQLQEKLQSIAALTKSIDTQSLQVYCLTSGIDTLGVRAVLAGGQGQDFGFSPAPDPGNPYDQESMQGQLWTDARGYMSKSQCALAPCTIHSFSFQCNRSEAVECRSIQYRVTGTIIRSWKRRPIDGYAHNCEEHLCSFSNQSSISLIRLPFFYAGAVIEARRVYDIQIKSL